MAEFDDDVPDLTGFEETSLIPTLKTVLFPNDGTLAFQTSFLDFLGSGLFAIRESLSQDLAVKLGSDQALDTNIEVPYPFEFDLTDDQGA